MTDAPEPNPDPPASDARVTRAERYSLVSQIEAVLDGPTTYLAIVFAALLVAELVLSAQNMAIPAILGWIQLAIWGVFVIHFLLGITISPDRGQYLRRNWLTALSLVVPFFRAFRALRAIRALRATNSLPRARRVQSDGEQPPGNSGVDACRLRRSPGFHRRLPRLSGTPDVRGRCSQLTDH